MLPRWRRDGGEIYYRKTDNSTVVGVPVEVSGGSVVTGQEKILFLAFQRWGLNSYDATPDGQRFAVNTFGGEASKPLAVVLNWPASLKGN
jgi:hypothetical protein